MRISDWSSDVCSSDLPRCAPSWLRRDMDAVSRRAPLRREADPQVDRGALIDLRHVGAILRRRWMILCAAMVAAIVVAAAAYLVAEPRYLATAQVALERTAEQVIDVDSVTPTADPDSAAVD